MEDYFAWSDRLNPNLLIEGIAASIRTDGRQLSNPITIPTPNFVAARHLAQTLGARAECHFLLGQPGEALRDLTLTHNFCRPVFEENKPSIWSEFINGWIHEPNLRLSRILITHGPTTRCQTIKISRGSNSIAPRTDDKFSLPLGPPPGHLPPLPIVGNGYFRPKLMLLLSFPLPGFLHALLGSPLGGDLPLPFCFHRPPLRCSAAGRPLARARPGFWLLGSTLVSRCQFAILASLLQA